MSKKVIKIRKAKDNEKIFSSRSVMLEGIGEIQLTISDRMFDAFQKYFDALRMWRRIKTVNTQTPLVYRQEQLVLDGLNLGYDLKEAVESYAIYMQDQANQAQNEAMMIAIFDNNFQVISNSEGQPSVKLVEGLTDIEVKLPDESSLEEWRQQGVLSGIKRNHRNPIEAKLNYITAFFMRDTKGELARELQNVMEEFTALAQSGQLGGKVETDEDGFRLGNVDSNSHGEASPSI